jgi:hypothetical protein
VPAVDSPNFRPARPPRLVSGTSTSMGGFPFRERGSGVSNRYNLDYWSWNFVRGVKKKAPGIWDYLSPWAMDCGPA